MTSDPRPSAKVAHVASLLDCDESDVRRMVRTGELKAHRKGKRGIRVYLDSVAAYQMSREVIPRKPGRAVAVQRASVNLASRAAADAILRGTRILT